MNHRRFSLDNFAPRRTKFLVALGVFAFLGLLVYRRAFSLGFMGDDAWVLYFCQTNWLLPLAESPHYPPLNYALYYLLYKAFHLNPLPYHLFTLSVAFLCAALVKTLAAELEFEPWQCWTAGILVLFNSAAAEVYYWFCINNTLLMTAAVVLGLICLLRFRLSRAWGWGAGYLALVFLAASVDGKGVILPLAGIILAYGWDQGDNWRAKGGLGIHLCSCGLVGGIFLVRLVWGIKSATINLPLREKWQTFTMTLTSTMFRGIDNHLWGWLQDWPRIWRYVPTILQLLLVALLIWGWLRSRGLDRRRLVTLVLLWILACLPHTLLANLQFRYFFLPGVFAALIIVTLLELLRGRIANGKGYLRVGLVALVILAFDLRGLYLARKSFQESSRIYDAGIREIKEKVPVMSPGTHLLLVDFPMFIHSQQNPGPPRPGHIHYVYVFPQSMPYHLRLLYRQDNIAVTFLRMAPDSLENPRPLGTATTLPQIRSLLTHPHTLAFRYLPGKVPKFVQIKRK
ncbi:MAG: hypothetical protein ACOZF2_07470 [Thermodesulfobacteriota bacterium]